MLGTTYARLHRTDPKLDKLLVDTTLGMCAQMTAMAAAFLGIVWFAIPAVAGASLMLVAPRRTADHP